MQVVAVDIWNGTPSDLRGFKNFVGATFPFLLNGGASAGGNVASLYGDRDNYVVISKQGIVRYHAQLHHDYGNRLFLNEIYDTVDSLVSQPVGVDPIALRRVTLAAAPNPFASTATIELGLPAESRVQVTVHDLAGRRLATLWDGTAPAGITRLRWEGRNERGDALPQGVYLVRARSDRSEEVRRIIKLQ